jgi:hypothetical protein
MRRAAARFQRGVRSHAAHAKRFLPGFFPVFKRI